MRRTQVVMLNERRRYDMTRKTFGLTAVVCSVWLMFCGTASAQSEVSGTLTIESTSIAAGIGVQWGNGVLTLPDGSEHTFSVTGLTVVDVGISSVSASGIVYHMDDVSEFSGNYVAAAAGAALGGGGTVSRLQNQNGVVIDLSATQQGVQLTLAPGGMAIELTE
jgi:hypothetical protein